MYEGMSTVQLLDYRSRMLNIRKDYEARVSFRGYQRDATYLALANRTLESIAIELKRRENV